MPEDLFEKTFIKAQEIQSKNRFIKPNDIDEIFICYGYSRSAENRDLAIAKQNISWAEIHLKYGGIEIYDPALDTYIPGKYFYRTFNAVCMHGLDLRFVELLYKKLGKYGPFDEGDIQTLNKMIKSEEFGAMKGGAYWSITKKLNIEDENHNQLCIVVERKKTKLRVEITICPKIFETPYKERKDFAIMSPAIYNDMLKLQEHLVQLFKEGMWDEVLKLIDKFQMLKYM